MKRTPYTRAQLLRERVALALQLRRQPELTRPAEHMMAACIIDGEILRHRLWTCKLSQSSRSMMVRGEI
jgi:hypothetical protein